MTRPCDSARYGEQAPMDEYTAAQREVIDQLGAVPAERPTFEADLRDRLRSELEDAAVGLVRQLAEDDRIFISKRHLGLVLGCQARYVAEQQIDFAWTVPLARGTLAHKAIELSIHWPVVTTPLDLTDETLARVESEADRDPAPGGLGQWLQGLSDAERSELRSEVNNRVAAFLESWPRLDKRWRPVVESSTTAELAGGIILLRGKVDLSLGRAEGQVAGKVLVDFKTGGTAQSHRDDLRFYALLDTLRIGTPPRLLATYYLDRGRFSSEDVTTALLDSTAARVIDATRRIIELRDSVADPPTAPGPGCRWCPIRSECHAGRRFLADAAGDESFAEDILFSP